MRIIRRIFSTFWVIWAVVVILFSMPIFLPLIAGVFFLKLNRAPWRAHVLSNAWAKFFLICLLIRVKKHGVHFLDKSRSYVCISNHKSQLDILACAVANPLAFRYLAKSSLAYHPVFGYLVRKIYLTVDTSSKEDRQRSMTVMRRSLEEGISVHIFPEGTRNRTRAPLKSFYDGAFRLAIEAQVPLAVFTIVGSGDLNSPVGFPFILPGYFHCYWDEPIETTGMTMDDMKRLKEKAQAIMLDHLRQK